MEGAACTDRDRLDGGLLVTSIAEPFAPIWRVCHEADPTPPPIGKKRIGKVIEARLNHGQATAKAEAPRKAGTPCTVNRI